MDWKAVGAKIVDFAPLLGTLLGGPIGPAAGGLVKVLANELGLKAEEATPDAFMKVLELDPNAVLKFKEFEMAHNVEIQKLILEEERMYLQDRADARSRQVESEKATGKRDINLYVLAYLYTGGFFITIIVMTIFTFLGKVPAEVPQFAVFLLGNLFGTLSAGVGAVMQYFFGSSKGSADKTAAIMELKEFAGTIGKKG